MRFTKLHFALAVAAMAMPGIARAQSSSQASADAHATTRIIQPITLSKASDLAFGTIVRPSSNTNTVTISEVNGARSLGGSGNAAVLTSTTSRAVYNVGGEGAQTFSITVPPTMTMNGSGTPIIVTLTASATSGALTGTLGSAGTAQFGVGGTFTLASTQASGDYDGVFTTTVQYN